MIQAKQTLDDYIGALKRRKGAMALVALVILAASVGLAFGLPPVYRSTATILIEQQEIPADLVRSTVTSYADQRIQVISQRVMTRSNLVDIIHKYGLYPDEQANEPMELIVEKMRGDVKLDMISADVVDPRSGRPMQATIAFTLSYQNSNPLLAQKVANELTSLILNENIKSREQMATETSAFLASESERIGNKLTVLEQQMADFKKRHNQQLPELIATNMALVDRTERDQLEVERELRSLRERKIFLESQLAQVSPGETLKSDNGDLVLPPGDRLKMLKSKAASMAGIYSANHPDLVRIKREIAALEAGGAESEKSKPDVELAELQAKLMAAKERYSPDHPDVKRLERQIAELKTAGQVGIAEADNPLYIQLRAQLQAVQADIKSQQDRSDALATQAIDYQSRIAQSPVVEREYKNLTRDYENALLEYKEIKAKQTDAQLAESLETERKGERLTLIDPPQTPEKPKSPNRVAILLAGFVFSLVGGIGTVAIREEVDTSIRGARGMMSALQMMPMVTIPYVTTDDERSRQKRIIGFWLGGTIATVVVAAMIIHFTVKPLDVLWFVAMRHLSI